MTETKIFPPACLRIAPNQPPCELRTSDDFAAFCLTEAEFECIRQPDPDQTAQQGERP